MGSVWSKDRDITLETWSFLTLNYSCLAEQLCIIKNIPTQIMMANIISTKGHANRMDAIDLWLFVYL